MAFKPGPARAKASDNVERPGPNEAKTPKTGSLGGLKPCPRNGAESRHQAALGAQVPRIPYLAPCDRGASDPARPGPNGEPFACQLGPCPLAHLARLRALPS